MKKVLRNVGLMMCAVLCIGIATYAQNQNNARVGLKGGLNLSNLYVNEADDENARIGWHAGFYAQLFPSEVFTIQPEVNFSTKGTGITYGSVGPTGVNVENETNI